MSSLRRLYAASNIAVDSTDELMEPRETKQPNRDRRQRHSVIKSKYRTCIRARPPEFIQSARIIRFSFVTTRQNGHLVATESRLLFTRFYLHIYTDDDVCHSVLQGRCPKEAAHTARARAL